MEIEIPSKEDSKDGTSLIFRKQELLEFSICNVPANPFALAKSRKEVRTETTQDLIRPNYWGGLINNLEE
jgi:phage head maturation protease